MHMVFACSAICIGVRGSDTQLGSYQALTIRRPLSPIMHGFIWPSDRIRRNRCDALGPFILLRGPIGGVYHSFYQLNALRKLTRNRKRFGYPSVGLIYGCCAALPQSLEDDRAALRNRLGNSLADEFLRRQFSAQLGDIVHLVQVTVWTMAERKRPLHLMAGVKAGGSKNILPQ